MARASGARIGSASAAISVGAGTTVLVAGVAGKRIKVYSYAVVADSAGTCKFSDGTDLTGAMSFAANGGISCAPGEDPWLVAASGNDLSIVCTAGTKGHLSYVIE